MSLRIYEIICFVLLCISSVLLIALQVKPEGWIVWVAGLLSLFLCRRDFAKNLFLVYIPLGVLGLIPITTDISYLNFLRMGTALGFAVLFPYLVSRFVYKENAVKFKFHHGRRWFKREILYIFLTIIIAYLVIPFYLRNTGAYLNWTVDLDPASIFRLFIGTNSLGIWDELFFVSTVLGILRRFLNFAWANVIQSVLFTSFLYELGFTGWGFIMIFVFALIQGIVFKKTDSLLYVITIHLSLDLILFLALIHAHHPDIMPIFLVK